MAILPRNGGSPIDILLVEDNPGDALLIKEALRGGSLRVHLHVVEDGEAAMQFLRREGPYTAATTPDLVLLDLNLPKKNGFEVLAEMKADAALRPLPVVILTSSSAKEDIEGAYDRYANCFITKPGDLDNLVTVVRSIERFWLSVVRLPRRAMA